MTKNEWQAFCKFKSEYKAECIKYLESLGYSYKPPSKRNSENTTTISSFFKEKENYFQDTNLSNLQKEAAIANKTPPYSIETPIVYNHNWDKINEQDEIKIIIVGDNPGKNEQLHKNQAYLVGQAGKLADGFFKKNPELEIDFRKNVIILNKTPIHTAKTKELAYLLKKENKSSNKFEELFNETQIFTAKKTIELQQALRCPIWLVGYGELRDKGLFKTYAKTIKEFYSKQKKSQIFLYQHFSMNRFIIDYNEKANSNLSLKENLTEIGIYHRKEILNF